MSQKIFISYAQNREDVMLWRALGHIENGFYIDVGANHPSDDSVTKAFYERGWCGINIEPLPSHLAQLEAERSRDINLGLALGEKEGEIKLYDTNVRGLATACSEVAQNHRERGFEVNSLNVPIQRLDAVWKTYVTGDVHFLKIDVEGFEEQVLRGMDLRNQRPWILVIEATQPNSSNLDTHWEPLVTSNNYQFVYFDGLNCYYIAQEHEYLAKKFSSPPNVFDAYITSEQWRLQNLVEEQQHSLEQLRQRLKREELLLASKKKQFNLLETQLQAMYASHSWRLTKPLRTVMEWVRRWRQKLAASEGQAVATAINTTKQKLLPNTVRWHANSLPQQVFSAFPSGSDAQLSSQFWWRISGHVEGHYSLAVVNRGLALALDAQSQNQVVWHAWHGQPYTVGDDIPIDQIDGVREILHRKLPVNAPVVSLTHHYPLIVDEEQADLRLSFFFWEESRVPEAMVAHLNMHTDAVLVSSRFVRSALRHSGYKRPIFIVPLGLAAYIHRAPVRDTCLVPQTDAPFRFLHVSSAFERKGVDVLLQAFFERFTAADNVQLLIKTFPNPHHDVEAQVQAWRARCPQGPQVQVDLRSLDDEQMLELYASAHAMVLPSRGEGFGLPAAEALALGLPLITTGFGGQTDFAAHSSAYVVPYSLGISRSHVRSDGSYWAEPSCNDLGLQMVTVRHAVLAKDDSLNARCQAAAQWVRQTYHWEHCARSVQEVAALMMGTKAQDATEGTGKQRLTVISPWQTTCGIAEYSQALLKGWEQTFDLHVLCDHRTPVDGSQTLFHPCWTLGNDAEVASLVESMLQMPASKRPSTVLLQHQPSLFALTDKLCESLIKLQEAGVVVILELHSTLPLTRELRLTPSAAKALRQLSLVVVHKLEDVNLALSLGWVENVMLLPLGIPTMRATGKRVTRSSLGLLESDVVLGCFGFLWSHKGVDSVIRSLQPLSKRLGKRVRLLSVTATPDAASQQVLAQYKTLAASLGVSDDVIWMTEFLPIQHSLDLLVLADFQVFAYGPTSESASAAVTIGLSTGRPVLVSDQPIFSDLDACTLRMSGNSGADIVEAVAGLIEEPARLQTLEDMQQQWLKDRAWPVVSARLQATVEGLLAQKALPESASATMLGRETPKQLLVDVSELVLRDAGTGIQRVVHSILREWMAHPPSGYIVRPICALKGQAYRYTEKFGVSSGAAAQTLEDQLVQVAAGDEFIGLDLSAHLFPEVESQLHAWRLAGVRVNYVVYDIIPLTHPDKVVSALTPAFETWMQGLYREADRLLCISQAVAQDVRQWFSQHTMEGALPEITHFHLGAQLPIAQDALGHASDHPWMEKLQDQPSFLMVGTVEPRKGYAQAVDAMELLWKSNSPAHLVVVGKRGWMVEQLCQRLEKHPERGHRLHWLEQADDATLQKLYRTCSALLAASEAEGFGLPLVEAAQQGLPIIARDISVFQEISQGHAFYFRGSEAADLAEALQEWIELNEKGLAPSSKAMPWLTWAESAWQLREALR